MTTHQPRRSTPKTEPIKLRQALAVHRDVELATARWVDWFNHRRLYQYCDTSRRSHEAA